MPTISSAKNQITAAAIEPTALSRTGRGADAEAAVAVGGVCPSVRVEVAAGETVGADSSATSGAAPSASSSRTRAPDARSRIRRRRFMESFKGFSTESEQSRADIEEPWPDLDRGDVRLTSPALADYTRCEAA